MENLISKIKEVNLLGRSGSMFPVALKWEAVKSSNALRKFVICNASEGEIETFKDYYILKNYPEVVVEGVNLAIAETGAEKAYIYLNKDYYKEIAAVLENFIGENIEIVEKKGGYVGGEETSLIEAIEGNEPEPRIKPPFPSYEGLWGFPTLVNNVETLYCVAKINQDEYKNERFFSIGGDAVNKGVFMLDKDMTVKQVMEDTNNIPSFDYFLQIGGGAGGTILLPGEIEDKIFDCLGSVVVYNREKTDPYLLLERWVDFLLEGNCDKCTPCREGLLRIKEMIEKKDFEEIDDIFLVMGDTSLCPLGKVAVNPFKSLLTKIVFKNENRD